MSPRYKTRDEGKKLSDAIFTAYETLSPPVRDSISRQVMHIANQFPKKAMLGEKGALELIGKLAVFMIRNDVEEI